MERFSRAEIDALDETAPSLKDLTLIQTLQAVSCTDALVGNDSGVTHLAAAMGIDTFALFGPTDPNVYRPLGPSVCVIHDRNPNFASAPSEANAEKLLRQLQKICA
jgi:ADP-heptose:LPS heptosyltransferase